MADEDCYSEIAAHGSGIIVAVKAGNKGNMAITACGTNLADEMSSTLSSGCPIKYTKDGAKYYNVAVDGETLTVYIAKSATSSEWEIQPSTCKKYK